MNYSFSLLLCKYQVQHKPGTRYFEKQVRAECGRHALNNALGGPQFLHQDLVHAAAEILAETGEATHQHIRRRGWYSHSVLARVLQNTTPTRWKVLVCPIQCDQHTWFCQTPEVIGALINEKGCHWTALVKHAAAIWYVDSTATPQLLDEEDFIGCLLSYPSAFAITSHEYEG